MNYLLNCLLLLPFIGAGQKIKVSEYDKFIKQKRVETSVSLIKSSPSAGLSIGFKSVGATYYALLTGYGLGASTISVDDQAIFLLDDDSTVIIKSTGVQSYEANLEKNKNKYNHEYRISLNGLEMLSRHAVKSIRKYGYKDYVNIDITPRNQDAIRKLSALFLKELDQEKVILTETVRLEDILNHVGDTITVCSRVYSGRYLTNVDNKPTLLNLGAPYPNQLLTMVIYEADRKKFNDAPETFYQDKEVCITGKVELYNNRPQIIIHNSNQVVVKD